MAADSAQTIFKRWFGFEPTTGGLADFIGGAFDEGTASALDAHLASLNKKFGFADPERRTYFVAFTAALYCSHFSQSSVVDEAPSGRARQRARFELWVWFFSDVIAGFEGYTGERPPKSTTRGESPYPFLAFCTTALFALRKICGAGGISHGGAQKAYLEAFRRNYRPQPKQKKELNI